MESLGVCIHSGRGGARKSGHPAANGRLDVINRLDNLLTKVLIAENDLYILDTP
jgi:hypothetical protein